MKKYVKVLALSLVFVLQAKADFISLPIHCGAILGMNGSNTDQVSVDIWGQGSNSIVAIVRDHKDMSRMYCQHLSTGSGAIECSGIWREDKSPARLSATTGTYVPFIRILRSQAIFHGVTDTGMCLER